MAVMLVKYVSDQLGGLMRFLAIRSSDLPVALPLTLALVFGLGCPEESDESNYGFAQPEADIRVARSTDDGASWSPPVALNADARLDVAYDGTPVLETDGLGTWVSLWQSRAFSGSIGVDIDILIVSSTDDGTSWAGQTWLNTNAGSDSQNDVLPVVETDGQGIWVAAWKTYDSLGGTIGTEGDILVARSTDDGLTWSTPAPLNTNAATDVGNDLRPQLVTDMQGVWIAVWYSYDPLDGTIGNDGDIFVSRSTDDGVTWTGPVALNTNAAGDEGNDFRPELATDGQGAWVAIWRSIDSLGDTIGTDSDIIVARSTDDGATWTAPAAVNTNASSDTGHDSWPVVTTDGQGIWIALWHSNDSLGDTIGADTDIFLARSVDDGASWTEVAPLNTNAAADSGSDLGPQLTTDGQGIWLAAWSSEDSFGNTIGTDADILLAYSDDDGITWTAPVALNTDAPDDFEGDSRIELTTDAQGTWVAVWEHEDLP